MREGRCVEVLGRMCRGSEGCQRGVGCGDAQSEQGRQVKVGDPAAGAAPGLLTVKGAGGDVDAFVELSGRVEVRCSVRLRGAWSGVGMRSRSRGDR